MTGSECPFQLWYHLAEQSVVTINLLQAYLIDAAKSAYHKFHI